MDSSEDSATFDTSSTLRSEPDVRTQLFLLLERLALAASVQFDRVHAQRRLQEVLNADPGHPAEKWVDWLVQTGRPLGLRLTPVEVTLREALKLLRPHDPIATFLPSASPPTWILLELSLWTVRAWNGANIVLTKGSLVRQMGLDSLDDTIAVLLVQPIAPCEDATTHVFFDAAHEEEGHDHGPMPPLRRLLAFLRPEWGDIRVVLIFGFFIGVFSLATPLAVEALVTTVMFGPLQQPLFILSLVLFVFLASSAMIKAMQVVVVEILQRRIFVHIVDDMAYRLPRVPQLALQGRYAPEIANRFFETVTLQKVGAYLALDGSAIAIQLLVGMTVLAFYHPWLIGFDVLLLVLLSIAIFVLGRGAVATAMNESRAKYATVAWLQDVARCSTAFRLSGAAEFAFARADLLATHYLGFRERHFKTLFRQVVFVLSLEAVLSTILLGMGGWLVLQGQLTLGQLVASELIVTTIVGSIAKLGKHIESYYDILAGMNKLGQVFDLPMESSDGRVLAPSDLGLRIELRDVEARTEDLGISVRGLSWRVEPGDCVVVRGSDAHRSLVADLLYSHRRSTSGSVWLDGIEMREISIDSVRRAAALVRDIEVFDGTIEDNVHVGRPEATSAAMQAAMDVTSLTQVLAQLPTGIKTRLTRGTGSPLTNSQLRRLVLARAIAGKPRLLLIDGCLDALPGAELRRLLGSLSTLAPACTVMVFTDREDLAPPHWRRLVLPDAAALALTNGTTMGK